MTHLPYNEPVTLKCTDTLLSIETFIGDPGSNYIVDC